MISRYGSAFGGDGFVVSSLANLSQRGSDTHFAAIYTEFVQGLISLWVRECLLMHQALLSLGWNPDARQIGDILGGLFVRNICTHTQATVF